MTDGHKDYGLFMAHLSVSIAIWSAICVKSSISGVIAIVMDIYQIPMVIN